MKRFLLCTSLSILSQTAFATPSINVDSWQKLWLNSDQQAEKLLEKGDAKAAAKAFLNPRHKAYAQLQAGDYANAVQGFGKFKDSDAFYNQGNAYAHLNQLQQALQAYEAALKLDPNNKDAQKNRDLVKEALKKQQQANNQQDKNNQQNQPNQQNQANQQNKSNQQSQAQNQQANQQKNSQSSPNKSQSDRDQNKQNQNAQNNQQNSADKAQNEKQTDANQAEAKSSETKPASSKESESRQAQSEQAKENTKQNAKDNPSLKQSQMTKPEQDTQAQAEKDAQAGVQSQQKSASEQALANETSLPKAGDHAMPAKNEQQIAQDQWLKQIPDDPSGLLRRKLLIEHLLRQRGLAQ